MAVANIATPIHAPVENIAMDQQPLDDIEIGVEVYDVGPWRRLFKTDRLEHTF